jgi:hypothetical protein
MGQPDELANGLIPSAEQALDFKHPSVIPHETFTRRDSVTTFATHEGKPMSKSIRTAEQIRDETQRRVEQLPADVPHHLRVRVPLPGRHPPETVQPEWLTEAEAVRDGFEWGRRFVRQKIEASADSL